jgi:CHAD domain-containing protein
MSELSLTPLQKETPGVMPCDSLSGAAQKVIRFHFERMVSNEIGTILGSDNEKLHDMRVAIRRMRVAFRVFEIELEWKGFGKALRKTGLVLGSVRDLDVFLENSQEYFDRRADLESGFRTLLFLEWSGMRNKTRKKMLSYLESEKYQKVKNSLGKYIEIQAVTEMDSIRVGDCAMQMIKTSLHEVIEMGNRMVNPTLVELHGLRIAFKKLRYTVEFFIDILVEDGYLLCIELLKRIQDCLGDINDANVAIKYLSDFIDDWPENLGSENREKIIEYKSFRQSELAQLISSFPKLWDEFVAGNFEKQLSVIEI